MWTIEYDATSPASGDRLFTVLADVEHWHEWNPGVARAELHGPFAAGTSAVMVMPDGEELAFTLLDVQPGRGFVDETPLPDLGVTVRVGHWLEPARQGGTRIVYRCEVDGPRAEELGAVVGPQVSGDFPQVIEALAARADTVRSA